jgi:hypothetical protein
MAEDDVARSRTYAQGDERHDEEWRINPRFPNYEVSSHGRVRRLTTVTNGRAGRILKAAQHYGGYWQHGLSVDGRAKNVLLNRLVCETFHGPAPSDAHVAAHGDHDRSNNRADNLRWATQLENEADKTRDHRRALGSGSGTSRLTDADIVVIRAWRGIAREIGDQYGISTSAVYQIWKRKTWKHIP